MSLNFYKSTHKIYKQKKVKDIVYKRYQDWMLSTGSWLSQVHTSILLKRPRRSASVFSCACLSCFQIFKLFYFSKNIFSIASSVLKKTAEKRTKVSNTYKSLKLENYPPSTVSGLHFNFIYILEITKKTKKKKKKQPFSIKRNWRANLGN